MIPFGLAHSVSFGPDCVHAYAIDLRRLPYVQESLWPLITAWDSSREQADTAVETTRLHVNKSHRVNELEG